MFRLANWTTTCLLVFCMLVAVSTDANAAGRRPGGPPPRRPVMLPTAYPFVVPMAPLPRRPIVPAPLPPFPLVPAPFPAVVPPALPPLAGWSAEFTGLARTEDRLRRELFDADPELPYGAVFPHRRPPESIWPEGPILLPPAPRRAAAVHPGPLEGEAEEIPLPPPEVIPRPPAEGGPAG